jgi:Rha family phage regulatory protein
MNSIDLGRDFETNHDQVIWFINDIIAHSPEDINHYFKVSEYIDVNGDECFMYLLTREGYALIVFRLFTPKAKAWQVKYIQKVVPRVSFTLFDKRFWFILLSLYLLVY